MYIFHSLDIYILYTLILYSLYNYMNIPAVREDVPLIFVLGNKKNALVVIPGHRFPCVSGG